MRALADRILELTGAITAREQRAQFLDKMDDDTLVYIHEMLVETLMKSYPQEKRENIDEFVTVHVFQLFPHLIEINLSRV